MKKISLVLLLFLVSCGSDKDSVSADNTLQLLTKQWFFINAIDLNQPSGQQEVFANECEQNRSLQFNSNGTFTETFFFLNPDEVCENDGALSGTFELQNTNNLILNESGGDVLQYEIQTLTQNQLSILFIEQNEIYTYQ